MAILPIVLFPGHCAVRGIIIVMDEEMNRSSYHGSTINEPD